MTKVLDDNPVSTDFHSAFGFYSSVRAASTAVPNEEMFDSRLDSIVFNLLEEFPDDR